MGDMKILKQINLALSFALEIALAIALGYWGYHLALGIYSKVFLATALPLALAVGWGLLLAPMARRRLRMPWLFITKTALFIAAPVALYADGRTDFAVAFAVLLGVNTALVVAWSQY